MSNLDYPISVLTEERDNIHGLPKNRVDQLGEAIRILSNERYKITKKTFRDSFPTKDDIEKKFREGKKDDKSKV